MDRGLEEATVTTKATDAPVYQLRVSLRGARPPIWRRFLIQSDTTLARLHEALQVIMGWEDCHLHEFEVDGVAYGESDREFGIRRVSETRTKLADVLTQPKDRMTYLYDFGDGWEHLVVLEKVLPAEPGASYPVVLSGRRGCPPEDSGGIWGYQVMLEALRDPNHPEHEEYAEWVEDDFDPELFDVGLPNAIFGAKRPRRRA